MKNLRFSGLAVSSNKRSFVGAVSCSMTLALFALCLGNTQAAVIADFTFGTPSSPTFDATSQSPNLLTTPNLYAGSGVEAGSGIDTAIGAFAPSFKFAAGNANLSGTDFIAFTVTASSGFKLNLTSLTFQAGTTSPNGNWAVSSTLGGYFNYIATGSVGNNVIAPQSVDLSGSSYQNLATITFRLYDWNTTGSEADWYDNFTLNGSVVPVPEPANVALGIFAAGAGVFSVGRRLRNRKSAIKAA